MCKDQVYHSYTLRNDNTGQNSGRKIPKDSRRQNLSTGRTSRTGSMPFLDMDRKETIDCNEKLQSLSACLRTGHTPRLSSDNPS